MRGKPTTPTLSTFVEQANAKLSHQTVEPQPDYRQWFIDQVAIGLICRGRGHTDAWRVAEAAWDQRQAHKALKKP